MSIYLDDEALMELNRLLGSSALQDYVIKSEREQHARGLRGEVTSNWLDSVMDRMYMNTSKTVDDAPQPFLVNEATGEKHTVESMVEHYKEAVGLDSITKEAALKIPLSIKQAKTEHGIVDFPSKKKDELDPEKENAILGDMLIDIHDHLSSHRGYADKQAIIYDLRNTYGDDIVEKFKVRVDEEIGKVRDSYSNDDPYGQLPYASKGQPLKVNYGPGPDSNIFQNIRDQGGSIGR